jgi:hypothetical protein
MERLPREERRVSALLVWCGKAWGGAATDGLELGRRSMAVVRRQCPRCHSRYIRRSRRSRWEWPLRAIRLYPFRCEDCRHRFLRFSLYGR